MHYSVLLNESIEGLNIKPNGIYVDCTLGYGGHSEQILKRAPSDGLGGQTDEEKLGVKYSQIEEMIETTRSFSS